LEALKPSKLEFDLGLKQSATLPSYFARDFPEPVFGSCEPSGYRADFFLLASHVSKAQSDPNNYAFYTVPVRDLHAYAAGPPKTLALDHLAASYRAVSFADLATELNRAADSFFTKASS
jgi:hypothetical protein